MRRLHPVCVSSCLILIEMDSCRTKLSSVQFTGDSQMPLLPPQCLALMSYFNGCLMDHKNLTMLCSYFCSCLPFIVNLIITELLYRLCGVWGDTYIYAEKFTNFFFLSKKHTELSHFTTLVKAVLIHILSINATSAFPLSLRVQDVSCHTEQCKRIFNGILFWKAATNA